MDVTTEIVLLVDIAIMQLGIPNANTLVISNDCSKLPSIIKKVTTGNCTKLSENEINFATIADFDLIFIEVNTLEYFTLNDLNRLQEDSVVVCLGDTTRLISKITRNFFINNNTYLITKSNINYGCIQQRIALITVSNHYTVSKHFNAFATKL